MEASERNPRESATLIYRPSVADVPVLDRLPGGRNVAGQAEGCATFWYHMFGANVGSLTVTEVKGETETVIWTKRREGGECVKRVSSRQRVRRKEL